MSKEKMIKAAKINQKLYFSKYSTLIEKIIKVQNELEQLLEELMEREDE